MYILPSEGREEVGTQGPPGTASDPMNMVKLPGGEGQPGVTDPDTGNRKWGTLQKEIGLACEVTTHL